MLLPTSRQMKELDRSAINKIGIPGTVLMENAGRGTVVHMEKCFGSLSGGNVLIFVGPGNNGGDGLVIARTIVNRQAQPHIFFLTDPENLTGDAALNYRIVKKMGVEYTILRTEKDVAEAEEQILKTSWLQKIHSVVDAVFGIGLAREVDGHFKQAVRLMNTLGTRYHLPITAVDIPSGMDSDTGREMGLTVRANLTVTYGFPKPAHFHNGGPGIGELRIVDIGIPPLLLNEIVPDGFVLNASTIPAINNKPVASHKGSNGHLLILAGATGKTGAAILCAKGALQSGAGLVTLGVATDLNPIFETTLPEAMTVPLRSSMGALNIKDHKEITSLVSGKSCLVTGPGIGTDDATAALIIRLYTEIKQPMVLDADALNILASHPDIFAAPGGPRILTPHPGEMARLLNITVPEVQADRLASTSQFNTAQFKGGYPVITVLKGAGTVLSSTDGRWCINTSGNPGMGAGGMGDVLAGIIGSFVCQGYSPWEAACLGVYLHGYSADMLNENKPFGYTASDVANRLPEAIGTLVNSIHAGKGTS